MNHWFKYSFLISFLLAIVLNGFSQTQYKADSGSISFVSNGVLEEIMAVSNKAKGVIQLDGNGVGIVVSIPSFQFENALMQEHFNENYMESEYFPTAMFTGRLNEKVNLATHERQQLSVSGSLSIKDIIRKHMIPTQVTVGEKGSIHVKAVFKIKLSDHNIRIPKVVNQKIAEEVDCFVDMVFYPTTQ